MSSARLPLGPRTRDASRMALDIQGPSRDAAIDDDGEPIVSRLPEQLGVRAPISS